MKKYNRPKIRNRNKHILAPTDTIQIQWLSDKYANFIKDKIYTSTGPFQHIGSKQYTDFRITDEDGDYYTLNPEHVNQRYRILSPEATVEKW